MSFRKNIKLNVKKVRRGRRKSTKNISKSLRFLGVNAAGLKSKLNTFKKVLKELQRIKRWRWSSTWLPQRIGASSS